MAFNEKYFKIFKYLFPRSNSFILFVQKKLTQFIEGLTALPDDFRTYIDNIYFDLFPDTTRAIELWENEFGIVPDTTDLATRRQNVDNRWKLKGGQGPDYIENTLVNAGFPVQVHENIPPVDPSTLISNNDLLVNGPIVIFIGPEYLIVAGGQNSFAGNNKAFSGYFEDITDPVLKEYEIPTDPDTWPYFWFIGGNATRNVSNELTNIDRVVIPLEDINEFITLILKIKPVHTWVGLAIDFATELTFFDGSNITFHDNTNISLKGNYKNSL